MFTTTTNKSKLQKPDSVPFKSQPIEGAEINSNIQQSTVDPIAFAEIAEKAHKHLRDFFVECTTKPKYLSSDWLPRGLQSLKLKEFCNKKIEKYIDFPEFTEEDVLQFFWKLLDWLDGRKAANSIPFEKGGTKRDLIDEDICDLLKIVKKEFLDGLCGISKEKTFLFTRLLNSFGTMFSSRNTFDAPSPQEELDKAVDESITDNWLLKKFMVYVGMTRVIDSEQWYVEFVRVKPEESPDVPDHFISYLLVNKKDQVLYILHNDAAISSGPQYYKGKNRFKYRYKHDEKYYTRLEKLVLHEFGHAVNHLSWYLQILDNKNPKHFLACKGREWVSALALHEYEAWAYAFSVRGCVKGTRSWITRIIEESDDEWYTL